MPTPHSASASRSFSVAPLVALPSQFQYQPPEAAAAQPVHVQFSERTPASAAPAAEPSGQGGDQRFVAYSYPQQYAAAGQYAGQYAAYYAYPQQGQPGAHQPAYHQQQAGQQYTAAYGYAQDDVPAQQAGQGHHGHQGEQVVAVAAHTVSPDSTPIYSAHAHAQQPAAAASGASAAGSVSATNSGYAQTQLDMPAAAPPPAGARTAYNPLAASKSQGQARPGSRPGSSLGSYNPLAHARGRGSAGSNGNGGPANSTLAHLFPGAK